MEEIKVFNKATVEVLSMAGIKQSVFNQSVALFLITSQDSLVQAAKLSFYTPFGISEENKHIEMEQAHEMYRQSSEAALEML